MWGKAPDEVLRGLLWCSGMQDPRLEALKSEPSVRLTVWAEWLRHGLTTAEDRLGNLTFITPTLARAVHEGHELILKAEANTLDVPFHVLDLCLSRQEKREQFLKACWEKSEVILTVLCDEESGSSALWCVRKNPLPVRYYEGGTERRERIQKQLASLIKALLARKELRS